MNTWYYIQWAATIAAAAFVVKLWFDFAQTLRYGSWLSGVVIAVSLACCTALIIFAIVISPILRPH